MTRRRSCRANAPSARAIRRPRRPDPRLPRPRPESTVPRFRAVPTCGLRGEDVGRVRRRAPSTETPGTRRPFIIVTEPGVGYRCESSARSFRLTHGVFTDVSSLAWAIAASDLGIRVTAPYFETDRFGETIEFVAYVRDFGSSAGTLVWYMPDPLPFKRMRHKVIYFVSALNPALYSEYDRERFMSLLTAWGWSRSEPAPDWYRGL